MPKNSLFFPSRKKRIDKSQRLRWEKPKEKGIPQHKNRICFLVLKKERRKKGAFWNSKLVIFWSKSVGNYFKFNCDLSKKKEIWCTFFAMVFLLGGYVDSMDKNFMKCNSKNSLKF